MLFEAEVLATKLLAPFPEFDVVVVSIVRSDAESSKSSFVFTDSECKTVEECDCDGKASEDVSKVELELTIVSLSG